MGIQLSFIGTIWRLIGSAKHCKHFKVTRRLRDKVIIQFKAAAISGIVKVLIAMHIFRSLHADITFITRSPSKIIEIGNNDLHRSPKIYFANGFYYKMLNDYDHQHSILLYFLLLFSTSN